MPAPDPNSELLVLMRSLRAFVEAQGAASRRSTVQTEYNTEKQREQTAAIEETIKGITKGRDLNEKQLALAEKVRQAKKDELELDYKIRNQRKELLNLEKAHGATDERTLASKKQLGLLESARGDATSKLQKAERALEFSFRGLIKGVDVAGLALTWFGVALKGQVQQLKDQYKATGGVIEGSNSIALSFLQMQDVAKQYGLSGSQLMEISKGARQTVNAMGGTEAAFKEMSPAIDRFRILTGSSAEAAKMAAQSAEYFAKHGVKPSAAAIDKYTDSLVELTKYTGLNTEQAAQYYNDIASDADSIELLRKARAGERDSILASQRAMVQQALAAGMSAEQAKEAAKMLNKMVAAKPLDRIKQAAKMRALGGALGIAGANEAAEGVMAGPRANANQKEAIAKFSEAAATALDGMAQQGMGPEIFASTLAEKLDLEKYLGSGSPFSLSLASELKPTTEALNKLGDASKARDAELIGLGIYAKERFDLFISGQDHWGLIFSAGLATIAGILTVSKLGDMVKTLGSLGKLLNNGSLLARGAAAAEGVSAAAGAAGAAEAGVAAGAVGAAEVGVAGAGAAGAAGLAGLAVPIAALMGSAAIAYATTTLVDGAVEKMTGKSMSERVSRWFKSDEEREVEKMLQVDQKKKDVNVKQMLQTGVPSKPEQKVVADNTNTKIDGKDVLEQMTAIAKAQNRTLEEVMKDVSVGKVDVQKEYSKIADTTQAATDTTAKQVGELRNSVDQSKQPATTPINPTVPEATKAKDLSDQSKAAQDTATTTKALLDASTTTADGVTSQVKQLGASNDFLQRLAQLSEKQNDLLEKQLVAMSLTDKEKDDKQSKSVLLKDNKFASSYGYV